MPFLPPNQQRQSIEGIGNMHKKFGEDWKCNCRDMVLDTDTQTCLLQYSASLPTAELQVLCNVFQNLLNNFRSSDIMAFIARIFLFFQMTTVFPLLLFIFRIQVFSALFGVIYPGSVEHFCLGLTGLTFAVDYVKWPCSIFVTVSL